MRGLHPAAAYTRTLALPRRYLQTAVLSPRAPPGQHHAQPLGQSLGQPRSQYSIQPYLLCPSRAVNSQHQLRKKKATWLWVPLDRLACHVSPSSILHVSLPQAPPLHTLPSTAPSLPFHASSHRAHAGLWKGTGTGAVTGTRIGAGIGAGTGTGVGTGTGAGIGTGIGTRIGTGTGVGVGTGPGKLGARARPLQGGPHTRTSDMEVEERGSPAEPRAAETPTAATAPTAPIPSAAAPAPRAAAPPPAEGAAAAAAEATTAAEAPPPAERAAAAEAATGGPWAVRSSITLSPKEEEIFATLLGTVAMFELKTVLRVAGGWVRDKLLGKECFDIDIALDDTLGREFAEHVNKYLESKGETARGVGVIRSNPDQSKHLETATMMVNGQWIDLVNLRAEAYADEGSRIPSQIEFGTAEQDALRRDLTINSLFYNINTKEVEDLTGRGLEDLRNGVIRTPLPPMQTFLDDPLRVLRAVRFAARFGFSVCEDLLSAASTEEVRAALGSKVSRERVGKETELMLKGRDPLGAVELLYTLGLFDTVFTLPRSQPQTLPGPLPSEPMASAKGEGRGGGVPLLVGLPPQHGQQGLVDLASAQRLAPRFMDAAAAGDDVLVATRLAAALLPLRNCTYPDRKKNPVPVTQHIIRESLKLKASLAEMVVSLHQHAAAFQALVPLLARSATAPGASSHTGTDVGNGAAGDGEGHRGAESMTEIGEETGAGGAGEQGGDAERGARGNGQGASTLGNDPRVQAGKLLKKAKGSWRSALLLCAAMGDPRTTHSTTHNETRSTAHSPTHSTAHSAAHSTTQGATHSTAHGTAHGATLHHHDIKRMKLGGLEEANGAPPSAWEQLCVAAADSIVAMGLEGVWDSKPLLNGKEVIACLKLGKGSRETGEWMERAAEWQLAHPQGTAEECRAWLVEAKGMRDGPGRG